MQLSWRQLLAPWLGALLAWLASFGIKVTPDQLLALMAAGAALAANGVHVLEAALAPRPAAGATDPAKKPPSPASTLKLLLPFILLLAALPWLHACSTLGAAPAQSTDESIAYGYGLYTAVESALSESLAAGEVSKATAIAVDQKAGTARELLDAARAAETVNPQGAARNLATATQVLTALQTWLNHPQGAVP